MVQYKDSQLDAVFSALSDRTRRGILASLAREDKSATALAAFYDMSLTGFMKHLQVLESAALVSHEKEGRVVQYSLTPDALRTVSDWLEKCREFWEPRLDALDRYLNEEEETSWPTTKTVRRSPSSDNSARRRRKSGKPGRPRKR